jgi:hypothetical protein
MEISITANGNHFGVRFKINSQSGEKVVGIGKVLEGHDIFRPDGG